MALTSKPTPAFTHNPTEDLGDYVMPQLIEWWKIVRVEHACYYKKYVVCNHKSSTDKRQHSRDKSENPESR